MTLARTSALELWSPIVCAVARASDATKVPVTRRRLRRLTAVYLGRDWGAVRGYRLLEA